MENEDQNIEYAGEIYSMSDIDSIENWSPVKSRGIRSKQSDYGFPTIILRSPLNLIAECEKAFDGGLLIATLTLVLTIPDVCSRIDSSDYRTWCEKYLHLANDGKKHTKEREPIKSEEDIDAGFENIINHGTFTASDLYQLRCAVIHAGSSSIDQKGAEYSPFQTIGICVRGNANNLVTNIGHRGRGTDGESISDCSYHCDILLEGLISLMAKGVTKFIREDPERNRELASTERFPREGITDFRPRLYK